MTAWRVLRVFAGAEIDTETRMRAGGIETYCPRYTQVRRQRNAHRDMTITRTRVLFPGYLFARVAYDFQAEPFERGGCKIVVFRKKAYSDSQIAAVRLTEWQVQSVSDHTRIERGALVVFWRGVMDGVQAEVLKIRGRNAVLSLIGNKREWHADVNDLETVSRVAS